MKQILFVALLGVASAQGVMAQVVRPSHGFLVVNGGYQVTANDFTDSAVKRANAEDGRLESTYLVKGGPTMDAAAGMIWRRLGIGGGVSRFTVSTPASVNGAVPHPFFFNRLRSVTGAAEGLSRQELAIHVQARGVFPVGRRMQVMVFGGPSFFQVRQGIVADFTYSDSYPYDSARFRAATTTDSSVSKMGFNGGGDVAFFFAKQVGLGGTVQFAGATVALPAAGGANRDVKVGGLKAGGGLRVRF